MISQTISPKEIVVVDSGTEEHRTETKDYLNHLGDIGIEIRLVGEKEMQAPEARNLGASSCTGDYLGFLDDDDEWYPDKLSLQLSLSNGSPAIIYSPYLEEEKGKFSEYCWASASYPEILARNLIGSTSFPLIRKKVFDCVGGFDTEFRTNQEWDLWIRVLKMYNCVYSQNLAGKKYDVGGLSADDSSRRAGWKMIFRKHRSDYSKNRTQHNEAAGIFYGDMRNRGNIMGVLESLIEKLR